jgi:diguanylate cyclase (GGDEF)-like protein/PAS domain S-box-containing protein
MTPPDRATALGALPAMSTPPTRTLPAPPSLRAMVSRGTPFTGQVAGMRTSDQHPRQVIPQPEPPVVSSESLYAALSDLGQLLLRSLDPAVLYEAVIEVLERRIGARLVMVGDVDQRTGRFQRVAPVHIAPGMEDIYPWQLPLDVAQPSFWQGTPQLETNIRHTPAMETFRQAFTRHGVTSSMAVPVMAFGEVRAGLVIRSSEVNFFSAPMIELLQQAAASIGLGLEAHEQRTRLLASVEHESLQRRALRLLSEMIKLVSRSKGESRLVTEACQLIQGSEDYDHAWIYLAQDETGQALQKHAGDRALCGSKNAVDIDPLLAVHADEIAVLAKSTGAPQVRYLSAQDLTESPVDHAKEAICALLALPLAVDESTVGALVIGATGQHLFKAIEIEIFSEMAIELGLGMHMQRTYAARVAAEHDLHFNLRHFRTILSHQNSGILVISEDDRVLFANDAFCALFDFEMAPAELENQHSGTIFARLTDVYEDPDKEFRRLREILRRGKAVRDEEVSLKDGSVLQRDFTPIHIDGVRYGRIWNQRDITAQKMHEARFERLASYDSITGLPNRRLFFELLGQARTQAKKEKSMLAIGVLDLDRFKSVNDSIGHSGGDRILAEASSRMLGMLRKADVLARFGGDEFALIIPGLDSKEQLDAISRCMLQALRAPFNLLGEQLNLSGSIGWTLFPLDASDAEGLVRHADLAMYAAKEEGKDRGVLYETAMELEQLRLQAMRERIAQALAQSRLRLLFQPIVYIDGLPGPHGVAAMEALIRLQDDELGLIEPANFAHVLDDPQLARPIGRFVLNEAFKQCQAWLQQGVSIPVSVNISTRHLLHPGFFSDIDVALEANPQIMDVGFGIEITETGPSMDHVQATVVIEECRRRGIRVGLDDFGTGSASLSHIQRLDIEHIKLDQSFVRDILRDDRNMAIAAGVITTARMLAKSVIAEGVESLEEGDVLASLGCHQLQGFSISRPMTTEAVPPWVMGWVPPPSWNHLASERQSLMDGRHANL